jgi:hypothetical protein
MCHNIRNEEARLGSPMARIYQRDGKKGATWYLDYEQDGQRIRRRLGKSKDLAESALADIQANLENQKIARTVASASQVVTILDRPVVIMPMAEYESLLAQAGRRPEPHLRKVLAKLKSP